MSEFAFDASLENFQEKVGEACMQTPVVVDFWAPWCAPCQTLKPMLEKLAEEYKGRFLLAKINSDENPEIAQHFGVRSIPSVKVLYQGQLVDEFNGALPENQVRAFLDRIALPAGETSLREQAAELIAAGWISMSSAVVSMKALNSLSHWFDPAFNVAEEADLFYRIAHDWELDYVDAPLTSWRVHGTNTTFAKFEQFAVETRQILAKLEKLYPGLPEEYPDLIPLLERRAVFQTAVALWRQGKNRAARQEISPHLFSGGGGVKFLAFWLLSWLPGSAFDALARVYLKLPKFLRR